MNLEEKTNLVIIVVKAEDCIVSIIMRKSKNMKKNTDNHLTYVPYASLK